MGLWSTIFNLLTEILHKKGNCVYINQKIKCLNKHWLAFRPTFCGINIVTLSWSICKSTHTAFYFNLKYDYYDIPRSNGSGMGSISWCIWHFYMTVVLQPSYYTHLERLADCGGLWQSQKAISAHFTSKQILPFGFAEQCGGFSVEPWWEKTNTPWNWISRQNNVNQRFSPKGICEFSGIIWSCSSLTHLFIPLFCFRARSRLGLSMHNEMSNTEILRKFPRLHYVISERQADHMDWRY